MKTILVRMGFVCVAAAVGVGCMAQDEFDRDAHRAGVFSTPTVVSEVVAGASHTCALISNGKVRCWGNNDFGQLGHGNTQIVGDDEEPGRVGDVNVGGHVVQLAAGSFHTCALLDTGNVRCWGRADHGQLGLTVSDPIGDDEVAAAGGDVPVGRPVVQIAAGFQHTCALLDNGNVRCWGANESGELGYGHTEMIGDDEYPSAAGDVSLLGPAVAIAAGGGSKGGHTCALLDTGDVQCWGANDDGQLGYGHTETIGDNETPAQAGYVKLSRPAHQLELGIGVGLEATSCALLDNGDVQCWGANSAGQLGYGHTSPIGDDEQPRDVDEVGVGDSVTLLAAGNQHTCAILSTRQVRCWGQGGRLGLGNLITIGDDEDPASAPTVPLGTTALSLAAGHGHTCALLTSGTVRCFGDNESGQLGLGHTQAIGDDEPALAGGDVNILDQ